MKNHLIVLRKHLAVCYAIRSGKVGRVISQQGHFNRNLIAKQAWVTKRYNLVFQKQCLVNLPLRQSM